MTQLAPPMQLRAGLQAMILRDLFGPAGGEEETVEERNVRGRYIVGFLAPKGQSAFSDDTEPGEPKENPLPSVDEEDDLATAAQDTEDGKTEPLVPKATMMLPSALGMTFTVNGQAKEIQFSAHWGRYERTTGATIILQLT